MTESEEIRSTKEDNDRLEEAVLKEFRKGKKRGMDLQKLRTERTDELTRKLFDARNFCKNSDDPEDYVHSTTEAYSHGIFTVYELFNEYNPQEIEVALNTYKYNLVGVDQGEDPFEMELRNIPD